VAPGYLQSLAQARATEAHDREEEARANAEPCTQEQNLQAVDRILSNLYGTAGPLDDLEPILIGEDDRVECDECERLVRRAWAYGAFRLCRACATRRLTLATQLADLDPVPAIERAAA
jgi:hypothetical protein